MGDSSEALMHPKARQGKARSGQVNSAGRNLQSGHGAGLPPRVGVSMGDARMLAGLELR